MRGHIGFSLETDLLVEEKEMTEGIELFDEDKKVILKIIFR